jgi:hypothetical protein
VKSPTTPQTGCALGAPPKGLASSFAFWWRAAAPFALHRLVEMQQMRFPLCFKPLGQKEIVATTKLHAICIS